MKRAIVAALAALVGLGLAAPSVARAQISLPVAYAGATCAFGDYRSGAIGSAPLARERGDIAGPKGNEIKQIYRVFFAYENTSDGKQGTGFAGWLMQMFDGTNAFNPAGDLRATMPLSLFTMDVTLPKDPARLPIAAWVTNLVHKAQTTQYSDDVSLILRNRVTATALAPCFSQAWNGSESAH